MYLLKYTLGTECLEHLAVSKDPLLLQEEAKEHNKENHPDQEYLIWSTVAADENGDASYESWVKGEYARYMIDPIKDLDDTGCDIPDCDAHP